MVVPGNYYVRLAGDGTLQDPIFGLVLNDRYFRLGIMELRKLVGLPGLSSLEVRLSLTCNSKCECSPGSRNGRVYRTNACEFPQVNWDFPQHSRRHKKLYAMRTQIERIISRVKRMLSFERFYGRGKKALQGFADRYVTVFNMVAYAAGACSARLCPKRNLLQQT